MKTSTIFKVILSLIFISVLSTAEETNQKSIAITVYNKNLGVVKDVRELDISSGTSVLKLTDVAQYIDPTSVHINIDGEVLEQNFQHDLVSMDKILRKYIDKNIQLVGEKEEFIEGKLISVNGFQIVLQKKDGGLLMLPSAGKYQISVGSLPEGLITKPTLIWMVNSNSSGKQDVEISYQTSGMNWHAEYVVVLNEDDTKLDLNSWVSVENKSGSTYKNAKLKLVAGDVNLVKNNYYNQQENDRVYAAKSIQRDDQFNEKQFFEYHIYDLQRKTTLANNETKQISLFEAADVKAEKKYYYGNRSGYYGGSNQKGKVSVIVEFKNSEANNLSKPMPKGKVRVYKSDGDALEFIGEDMIDHTPKKEKVKLKIGEAFDIVVEDVQAENRKITNKVYEQSYVVTITNRKNEDIIVDVERMMGFNWEILSSSLKYEKKDSKRILFKVPVKADTKTVLKYKVRYVH